VAQDIGLAGARQRGHSSDFTTSLALAKAPRGSFGFRCDGAGRVCGPSGLPSIADIRLHCREPPQRAKN
jgi:hypothetical protein